MPKSEANKPLCYRCEYIGNVPGSCHHSCHHPATQAARDNPLSELMVLLSGLGGGRSLPTPCKGIEVSANKHGLANGWFAWPHNFDPVWLTSCDGFKAKGE